MKKSCIDIPPTNQQPTEPYVKQIRTLGGEERDRLFSLGVGLTEESYVCVFKPKAQALDNWGWCNGVNANGEAVGYYNDGEGGEECNDNTLAWTSFRGSIILVPPAPLP